MRLRKLCATAPYAERVTNPDTVVDALLCLTRPLVGIGVRSVQSASGGVTIPQYRVLVLLEDNGALSIGAIALELGVNPSNATRVCDRLERLGLATRAASSRDRRSVLVGITQAGRRVVAAVTAERRRELARVAERLDGATSDTLVRVLDEVAQAARAVERADLATRA
jgi:DNA-binding MarR family transcriptional regulator